MFPPPCPLAPHTGRGHLPGFYPGANQMLEWTHVPSLSISSFHLCCIVIPPEMGPQLHCPIRENQEPHEGMMGKAGPTSQLAAWSCWWPPSERTCFREASRGAHRAKGWRKPIRMALLKLLATGLAEASKLFKYRN